MFEVLNLGDDRSISAVCTANEGGSEVLLFRRNEGFLGRLFVPETGDALQKRLELSAALHARGGFSESHAAENPGEIIPDPIPNRAR